MKAALIGLALIMSYIPAEAQRSSYVSSNGVGVLQVLPQYGTLNRFGDSPTPAPPKPTDSNTLEDPALINRVSTWPKDKQPFWFLNSQYVSNHRGVNAPVQGSQLRRFNQ